MQEREQQQILQKCASLLGHSNMQVVINSVYVLGNLQEWARGSLQEWVHVRVLAVLQTVAADYPTYEGCIGLLIWYLRGILIM